MNTLIFSLIITSSLIVASCSGSNFSSDASEGQKKTTSKSPGAGGAGGAGDGSNANGTNGTSGTNGANATTEQNGLNGTSVEDLGFESGGTAVVLETNTTGINADGKSSICLDYKAGSIIVTKLYNKYFYVSGTIESVDSKGVKVPTQFNGEGTFKLPGTWADKVCGARAEITSFTFNTSGNRQQPPAITTTQESNKACIQIDDAEGNRGGTVTIHGVNWHIQKC